MGKGLVTEALTRLNEANDTGRLPSSTVHQLLSVLRDVTEGCYGSPKEAMVAGTQNALVQFADDL